VKGGGDNGGGKLWSNSSDVGSNPAVGQGQDVEGEAEELVRAASPRERLRGGGKAMKGPWRCLCGQRERKKEGGNLSRRRHVE
jgi:hypothetical protein